MKKTLAIPAALQRPYEDLTPEEKIELAKFGDQPLTPEEIAEREAQEVAWANEKVRIEKAQQRLKALATKWVDPFALIDDILDRGMEAVKTERDGIKADNPKGE